MPHVPSRHRRLSTVATAAACILTALVVTGCSQGEAGTKAGGALPPVTLRLGTDDTPGRPSDAQISRFVEEVARASAGRVRVEPRWRAAGDTRDDDSDQKVARLVVSGDLDLALVPSRAWDTEGVSSLRALNAPFLVTSTELTEAVVTSPLADQMLAGLGTVGVRGLALLPEDLRYLMSFTRPVVRADDIKGARIRVPASRTTYAAFQALGARPDDASASGDAILRGDVDAVESQFGLASTFPRFPRYATGNVPLWPKVNSLVVNAATYARLAPEVQSILVAAARRTRDWSLARPDHLGADVQRYCASGGTVVFATPADLADLRAATAPVTAELERDGATRALIESITALARETDSRPEAAPACGPAPTTTATATASATASASARLTPGQYSAFPEGAFRAKVPADVLSRAGVSGSQTEDHAGVWTLTFTGGRLTIDDTNDATGAVSHGRGIYCADSTEVAMSLEDPPGTTPTECGTFVTARWTLDDDRLRLSDVRSPDTGSARLLAALFGSTEFRRVR